MFIETIKNNGKPYLRLVHAIRKPNKNGEMVSTKNVILNIGPLDRFDDGQPHYLEKMLEELGLNTFFSSYKAFTKIKFDVYGFAKLLLFGRILNPASKYATTEQNNDYFEPILSDGFNKGNVYDTLSFIFENKDKIIRRLNTNLVKKANRSPEIIYYDVT